MNEEHARKRVVEWKSTPRLRQILDYLRAVAFSLGCLAAAGIAVSLNAETRVNEVRHIKICGSENTFCGWPRQAGIGNFGKGEIAVLHHHAPCAYQTKEDLSHVSVHARSVILLQRSTDNGNTWPQQNNVIVWRSGAPAEELKRRLFHGHTVPRLDMLQPSAMFYFQSMFQSQEALGQRSYQVAVLRSVDKGHTWNSPAALLPEPPVSPDLGIIVRDNHPPVRLNQGGLVIPVTVDRGVAIYHSQNDGQSWEYLSQMAPNPDSGRFTYAGLFLLPDGTLQGYALHIQAPATDKTVRGLTNAICLFESRDDGKNWGPPRSILHPGSTKNWGEVRDPEAPSGTAAYYYRSPWPIRLRDGKIVVLFARRLPPYGIGALVSSDNGKNWSDEFVLRKDGGNWDLGYPVATQLDDGRVFAAYYFNQGDYATARRFIAGTFFRVE